MSGSTPLSPTILLLCCNWQPAQAENLGSKDVWVQVPPIAPNLSPILHRGFFLHSIYSNMDNNNTQMTQAGFIQEGQTVPPTPPIQAPMNVPQPVVVAPIISTTPTVTGNNNNISISSMIQDNSGGISSIRILMLTWGLGIFLLWGTAWGISIYKGNYSPPSIPGEAVTIVLGVSGAKAVQRYGEK